MLTGDRERVSNGLARRKRPASAAGHHFIVSAVSHVRISGDRWADDVRLSDLEPRFTCQACSQRGADVRPEWQSAEAYA
jgi:hypothetical protein